MSCNLQRPATLLLGGPAASEARESLVFTPDFPCGVEANYATGEVTPLRAITVFGGCVGTDRPGDLVLISSRVQAIRQERSGLIRPFQMEDCAQNVARKQPRVKLKVTHCSRATSLIIDADSSVVVPAGEIRIDALVPGPLATDVSFNFGAWQEYGALTVPVGIWEDTRLEVMACPAGACCPCGVLTNRMLFAFDGELDNILIVPHGARSLAVSAQSLGVPTDIRVGYLVDMQNAASVVAQDTIAANNRTRVQLFGDAQAITITNPADEDHDAWVRWEVCGP